MTRYFSNVVETVQGRSSTIGVSADTPATLGSIRRSGRFQYSPTNFSVVHRLGYVAADNFFQSERQTFREKVEGYYCVGADKALKFLIAIPHWRALVGTEWNGQEKSRAGHGRNISQKRE